MPTAWMLSLMIEPRIDEVAARRLELGDRRDELGVHRAVGRFARDLELHGLGLLAHAVPDLVTEVGVLVHGADFLLALLLDEVLHHRAHLVVVGGEGRELELVEGLGHRARRREREQVGHALLQLLAEHGVVLRRAESAHHGEDLVVVDELVGGLHGARGLVLVVLDDELDLAAVDALLVGLVEAHAHAFGGADAPGAHRPAQGRMIADDDFRGRDAVLGERRCGEHAGKQRSQRQPGQFPHVDLHWFPCSPTKCLSLVCGFVLPLARHPVKPERPRRLPLPACVHAEHGFAMTRGSG